MNSSYFKIFTVILVSSLLGYTIEIERTYEGDYKKIRNNSILEDNNGIEIGYVKTIKKSSSNGNQWIWIIKITNDDISIEGKEKFINASGKKLIIDFDLIKAEEEAAKAAEEAAAAKAAEEAAAAKAAEEAAAAKAAEEAAAAKAAEEAAAAKAAEEAAAAKAAEEAAAAKAAEEAAAAKAAEEAAATKELEDWFLIEAAKAAEEAAAAKAAEEAAAAKAAEEASAKAFEEAVAKAVEEAVTIKEEASSSRNYNTNPNFSVSNNKIKPYILAQTHAKLDAKANKKIGSRFFWGAAGFGSFIVDIAIGLPMVSSGITVASAYYLTPKNIPMPPERFHQAKKILNQKEWEAYSRSYSLKRWEIERRKNIIAAGGGVLLVPVFFIGLLFTLILFSS